MGDLTPEEMRRWRERMGDQKVRGSPEPIPGRCGAQINRQNKILRDLEITTPRYCMRPAGAGTDHLGYKTCKTHLGNVKTMVRSAQREIVAQEFKKTLAERIGDADLIAEPEVVMAKLAAMAGAYLEVLTEQMAFIEGQMVTTDISGVERSRAIMEAWERAHTLVRDTVAFMMKHGLKERLVQLEEHQAYTLARAVLEILNNPQLELTEAQVDLFKSEFRAVVEQHSAGLEPSWALKSGMSNQIVTAEVIDE